MSARKPAATPPKGRKAVADDPCRTPTEEEWDRIGALVGIRPGSSDYWRPQMLHDHLIPSPSEYHGRRGPTVEHLEELSRLTKELSRALGGLKDGKDAAGYDAGMFLEYEIDKRPLRSTTGDRSPTRDLQRELRAFEKLIQNAIKEVKATLKGGGRDPSPVFKFVLRLTGAVGIAGGNVTFEKNYGKGSFRDLLDALIPYLPSELHLADTHNATIDRAVRCAKEQVREIMRARERRLAKALKRAHLQQDLK